MQGTISNYEVMKQSMAGAFLTYDQKTMINKFMLESDPLWIYMTFVGRRYRIGRDKGNVQWTEDDFHTVYEADYNEAMTIYDVLCYAKEGCHLAHEWVNVNSLSTVKTGNLMQDAGFFQSTAVFFQGKVEKLRRACLRLSGKSLEKGDLAFELELFPFVPVVLRYWEADDEFPAALQILLDRNILDYMHYETVMFALIHLFKRLKEEMQK